MNKKLNDNQIAMRKGMVWNIDLESKYPFSWFCYRSPQMVEEFDLFLKICSDRKCFIDIGANHGVFSLAFTCNRPNVKAIALDLSPLAFPILKHNSQLNPTFNITPLQVAVGEKTGELRMKLNWHHLEVISDQTLEETDEIKIVPVRDLDSLCDEMNIIPDLIKVDVEGHELAVLMGMNKILFNLRVDFFLEIHPELIEPLGYQVNDITDYLSELNYEFYGLDGKKLTVSWITDQIHTFWVICRPI
jgi:FkbM family methyltransferase